MTNKTINNLLKWKEITGYETKTTFYADFTIAEAFDVSAIVDTYNRAFNEWHNDVEYVTELCMVLNWKVWDWYQIDNQIANAYNDLWKTTDNWCMDNLKGKDLSYFLKVTD